MLAWPHMPRAVPVLVLGLVILGCSKRPPNVVRPETGIEAPAEPAAGDWEPSPPPIEPSAPEPPTTTPDEHPTDPQDTPRPGGTIQVFDPAQALEPMLLAALATPPRIFAEPSAWRTDGRCWIVPVAGEERASEIVSAWNEALARGPGPLHWLLALESARGRVERGERLLDRAEVRGEADGVRVCGTSSVYDLAARLEHPALRRALASSRAVDRRSPFLARVGGRYVANTTLGDGAPYVDRIDTVDKGAPALLFKLGDVDLAVVQGHDVRTLEALPDRVTLSRAPAREPTYFLWLHPANRWLAVESFRRWLAGVDRPKIIDLLFDGRGSRAYALRAEGTAVPLYEGRPDPPFPETSEPRFVLRFDRSDPSAELLAARMRAELGTSNVELQVEGVEAEDLLDRLARGDIEAALLRHRPESPDPILALLGTVWWLGEQAEAETLALLDATRLEDPLARAEAATEIERVLLADACLVPLVRLESWLAVRTGLAGVRVDPDGTLRLDGAWWRP